MGGAATVCIQYSDGSRDSYAGYNLGMSIIAKDALECCEWDADEDFESTEEQWRIFLDRGVTPFGKTLAECIEEFAALETGKENP